MTDFTMNMQERKYSIPKNVTLSKLEVLISDVFSTVISGRLSADKLADMLKERIYDPLNLKYLNGRYKHSNYIKGFAYGIITARRSEIWAKHVEFCYIFKDELYSTHAETDKRKVSEFYDTGRGHLLGDLPCAHFWKGSDKPFTSTGG